MSVPASLRVAVVGASGLVGESMIQVLEERRFPLVELFALASERSLGRRLQFREQALPLQTVDSFDFARAQLALFAAPPEVAAEWAPRALSAGCSVIDTSSAFRARAEVPLVVAGVNDAALAAEKGGVGEARLVATPGELASALALALGPLQAAAGIERLSIASYQAVSGAGRAAVEELAAHSIELLSGRGGASGGLLPKPIAFNCVPQDGPIEADGVTAAERALGQELARVLGQPALRVQATAVWVPVFYGHSAAVQIETQRKFSAAQARTLLRGTPGVQVLDEHRAGGYPTAVTEAANHDTVWVGRIREDMSHERGLCLWIVSDNVRQAAATNSVRIAEVLARDYL